MKKLILYLSIIMTLSSCISSSVPVQYTKKGKENFIESEKRIKKEKRQIKREHRKMTKRIKHIQNEPSPTYKRR